MKFRCRWVAAGLSLMISSGHLVAQNTDQKEEITVTGSRIKRLDVEGPNPVIVIDRSTMAESPKETVAEFLKGMTQSMTGVLTGAVPADGNTDAVGKSQVDLKGIGPQYTLVLLNGRRLPTNPLTGVADLNTVPLSLVERIEVLNDSAAAVYGSAAVGGVINVITRNKMDYQEASFSQSVTSEVGGERTALSYTYGNRKNGQGLIAGLGYFKQQKVKSKDRDGATIMYSTSSNPGNFLWLAGSEAGKNYMDPTCAADRIGINPDNGSQYCHFPNSDRSDLMPDITNTSLFADYSQPVGDMNLSVYLQASQVESEVSQVPITTLSKVLATRSDAFGIAGDPNPGILFYSFDKEFGTQVHTDKSQTQTAIFSLDGEMAQTWDWEFNVSTSRLSNDSDRTGSFLHEPVYGLIKSGQYNPFDPARDQSLITPYGTDQTWTLSSNNLVADFIATSELAELADGPLSLSVGTSYTAVDYETDSDANQLSGATIAAQGRQGSGDRTVQAIFAETLIPFAEGAEAQVAVRHDNFSDVGASTNPKLGLAYRINSDMMVRGSTGTGFRAPQLKETNPFDKTVSAVILRDFAKCDPTDAATRARFCNPSFKPVNTADNPDLKPERSFSYNIGFLYGNETVNFKADYWYLRVQDAIRWINPLQITQLEKAGSLPSEVTVDRDQTTGVIDQINSSYVNFAEIEKSGIDVSIGTSIDAGPGKFGYNISYSRPLTYTQELGSLKEEPIGAWDVRNPNPKYLMKNDFKYSTQQHVVNLSAFQFGEYLDYDVTKNVEQKPTNFYDLTYTYIGDWDGTISLAISNLTNEQEPLDETIRISGLQTGKFSHPNIQDPIGRAIALRATQRF